MNKKEFREYIRKNIVLLDGATGTELQKKGMPKGVCPEQWVLEHPDVLVEIQQNYLKAGSNVVYTCTFGANRIKLEEFGLENQVIDLNRKLAQISRKAVGNKGLVAGDLAPTGQFVRPMGDMSFEELVNVYKEQVQGLLEGGVDFFIAETMMDIQEARAAILAVKESCDLPICVTMTFNENGRTLTGTDPVTALITLQSLGADAVGCNCSTGPEEMLDIIRKMHPYAKVPLIAKPNAGIPKTVNGETIFTLTAKEFGQYIKSFVELGVNMIGGCCGTSPEYIAEIACNVQGLKPVQKEKIEFSALTSSRKTVFLGNTVPLNIIGERINPTGKKRLQAQLKQNDIEGVIEYALEQVEEGAEILDVNVGMPGIDEKEMMLKIIEQLSIRVQAPLCIDSSSPEVIEGALRIYPGRALINSISAEKNKIEKLLPIAAKYGAMFILLPLNDQGVPQKAEARCTIIEEVYNKALEYGFSKSDILIDGLVMTVSSDQAAALETLKVIQWCSQSFKCGTVIGLSNISFGLPERSWINGAFLAMAMEKGLTTVIANPSNEIVKNIKMASDLLRMRDMHSQNYIAHFTKLDQAKDQFKEKEAKLPISQQIYDGVVKGKKESITALIEKALKEGYKAVQLIDEYLIPAITEVGDLFEQRKYFLPQLIQSAETMKKAFEYLEPLLKKEENQERHKAKIVLATVKGDIHDIGKNIVGLMLKNYGFEVYDLGKDVAAGEIIQKAKELNAEIIGLSALMTTTMLEMKEVINLAKQEELDCKFMVGGAVVNEKFASEIGADGYAADAHRAVKLAQALIKKL